MGGLSRRGLFTGLIAAPLAIAAGMPFADKLGWMARLRHGAWLIGQSINPVVNVSVVEDNSQALTEIRKWQAAHPFGRYKTAKGAAIGRAKHAMLHRELMLEHGLPEYRNDLPDEYIRKALEETGMYIFSPEPSYGERAAREFYGW